MNIKNYILNLLRKKQKNTVKIDDELEREISTLKQLINTVKENTEHLLLDCPRFESQRREIIQPFMRQLSTVHQNLNNKINTFYKFDKTYYNSRSVQIQINLIYIEYISNNYFNLITTTKPPSF